MVTEADQRKHGHAGSADDEDRADSGSVASEYSTFREDGHCGSSIKQGHKICEDSALRTGRVAVAGATPSHTTVYQATPLFQQGLKMWDYCIFIWVTVSHLFLTFWPLCGLAIMAGSLFSRTLAYITIFALGTLLLPPCPHIQQVINVLDRCVFYHWKRHISLKVVHEPGFDPEQQYLVACFPHGAFPLAAQMHVTVWPRLNRSPLSLLAATVLFYCPLWRHYMSVGGCVPANFRRLLRELAAGNSTMVHAGGIAEMFVCESDREVIVLRNRRGFVRAAVQHGVPLLPVYYFGNSQLLSFGPRCLRPLSRRLKMSLGLVHGMLGLPVLRHRPVTAVVGSPIPVGEAAAPGSPDFDSRVEVLHQQFTHDLICLYERHRGEHTCGAQTWAERPLVVT